MNDSKKFITIRQFHAKHPNILAEHSIRALVRQGEIPGLRVGNRFLINEEAFLEKLGCSVDAK